MGLLNIPEDLRVWMGEGGWCPSGLCTPSLPSISSPWYLSCQQEKVTMLFFSPPVLPSCPSPNLSYLTLILTCGFGPGSGGVCVCGWGCEEIHFP